MTLTDAEQRFLARHPRGHLATVGPSGLPQVKPLGFTYNADLGTIDIAGFNMAGSAKYRNVRSHPHVAFVVDEVTAPTMEGAHFLEIRGEAETATGPIDPSGHLAPEIIRIHPRRVVAFNIDPDQPGFQTRDTPPVGGRTVAPPVGGRTVAPPVGGRTVAPPVGGRTVTPPVGGRGVA